MGLSKLKLCWRKRRPWKCLLLMLLVLFGVFMCCVVVRLLVRTLARHREIRAKKNHPLTEGLFKFEEVGTRCGAIIDSDENALQKAVKTAKALRSKERLVVVTENAYVSITKNCPWYKYIRGFITTSLSKEEEQFPIAYSILVHKDSEMVERLLRAIYRPQNIYCIHVDKNANVSFYNVMRYIGNCFENVHVLTDRVAVRWASFSTLEADLACMRHLLTYPRWQYLINLGGQEFPLKTNLELVRILKKLNGANDVSANAKLSSEKWFPPDKPPPLKLRALKGSTHIVGSRAFINYSLNHPKAKTVLNWVRTLPWLNDEVFYATLNHNKALDVPGSYRGIHYDVPERKPFLSRYKIWVWAKRFCASKRFVREICILSIGDLPLLARSRKLFANKFYLSEDRVVIGCLEELLYNRTRDGVLGTLKDDTDFYRDLEWVKHKYTP